MATYNITRHRTNASNRSINSSVVTGYGGYYDMWYPNNLSGVFDESTLKVLVDNVDVTSQVLTFNSLTEIQCFIPDALLTGNVDLTYSADTGDTSVTGEVHLINMEHCESNLYASKLDNNVLKNEYCSYTSQGRVFSGINTIGSKYQNSNRIALIANDGYGIRKSDVDGNTFDAKQNKLYLTGRFNSKVYQVVGTINGFDGLITVDGVDYYTVAYIDFGKSFNDKYNAYNGGAWAINLANDTARAGTYYDIRGAEEAGETRVGTLDGSIFVPTSTITTYNVTNNLTQCTTNNSDTTVDSDETYSATLTANAGYHFNTENVVVTCGEFDEQFTISADKQTVTINITDVVGDIYISATATNELPQYDITSTLNHATNSNSATTIEQGQNYSATLTCDAHYTFTGGTLVVSHNGQTVTPTLNANGTVATISINNVQGDIIITGSAVALQYNFTHSLTNCQFIAISGIQSGNKINDGDTVTGTIRVNNYSSGYSPYYFKAQDISITMGDVTQTYTLSSDNYIIDFSIANVSGDVAINVSASIDTYTCTLNFTGFSDNPAPSMIPTDGVISKATTVEVYGIALEEYEIKSENVHVTINGVETTNFWSLHKQPSNLEYYNYFQMIITGDNRRYITGDIVVTVTATPVRPPVVNEDFGFCNVYNPTLAELAEVSKKRFYQGSGQTTSYVDMSQFIYRVYKTYLEIPVADDRETVKLANYDTQVLSDVVAETPIDVDCGTVTLEEVFENVIDYSPFTTLDIYLPFIGIQRLDIDVVRNKAIHLVYTFDVLSAKCLAKLLYNNEVLYQFAGSIADDIPYVATNTGDYNSNVIQTTTESALTLGKNYPYYIITQNVGIEPDEDIDGVAQYESVQLSTLTGLVQVNNINLSTTATEEEKTEIEMLLKQGVFINEV